MIVAFSGIDGSGKTTQARYVADLLEQGGWRVRYIHMIRWTLVNWLGRSMRSDGGKNRVASAKNSPRKAFVMLWRLVALLDVARFWVMAAYAGGFRNRAIVCDRFFYDLGVQACYKGLMSAAFETVYWRLVPSPTASILLDVSPKVAHQREGGHEISYYETKRDLYLSRASRWGATVVSGVEMNETRQAVHQILQNRLEQL